MTVQIFKKDTKELRTTLYNVVSVSRKKDGEIVISKENGITLNLGKDLYEMRLV